MKIRSKRIILSSLACFGLAFAPSAFAAESLEIRDFVGVINWSNGPMGVDVEANKGDLKVSEGRRVIIDGGIEAPNGSDCESSYGHYDLDWFGKKKKGHFGGYENLEDYPVLNITLPANTALVIRNSILFTQGEPDVRSADIDLAHCGSTKLGNIQNNLTLDSRGSADISVGDTGRVQAILRGSGDLSGRNSGKVNIAANGSGDVELGSTKALDVSVHGSGDLETSDIEGDVKISSHGSGDVELGEIDGSLIYSGHGSGELEVSSVTGPSLSLKSNGSGDIDIASGEVEKLMVSVSGSADVEYDGKAGKANLRTSGSGDISVNRVDGLAEVKASGSGDIDVGQR